MEGNQVSARRGEEYVINRAMYLCSPCFSWREIAQKMAWPSRRFHKICLLKKLVFKYFKHKDLLILTYLLTYLLLTYLLTYVGGDWIPDPLSGILGIADSTILQAKICRIPVSTGKKFGFVNPDYHNMGRIRNFLFWRLVWIWFVTLRKITSLFYMNFKIYDIKRVNKKRLLK